MASIAIPVATALIQAALPVLTPLAQNLIVHAEALWGAKTGTTKFNWVFDALSAAAAALGTAGKLPGQLDAGTIGTIVETNVQDIKAKNGGQVPTTAAPSPVASTPKPGTFQVSGTINLT